MQPQFPQCDRYLIRHNDSGGYVTDWPLAVDQSPEGFALVTLDNLVLPPPDYSLVRHTPEEGVST